MEEEAGTQTTAEALVGERRAKRDALRSLGIDPYPLRFDRTDTAAALRERYGDQVAAVVPQDGLVDVHRYLRIQIGGREITLDVTFPGGEPWDGKSSLPLACGAGEDVAAGEDPDSDKRALEARYCDPTVREPFIAALTAASEARS